MSAGNPLPAPLVTRDFVVATAANALNGFGQQMLTATLPIYVLSLGGTPADAGLVSGAMAFTAMLLRPLIGYITDIWRRRPLVIIGTSCYALASLIYLSAGSIPALVAGRVLHGYGLCNYTTASNAYLADIAPPRRRAEAIGIFTTAQSVGVVVSPALGFVIIQALGFQWLFTLTAGLALTAVALSLFARERRARPTAKRAPWSPRTGLIALSALPVAWSAVCLGVGFGPLGAFIAIFARSRGIENPGVFFTVQALALIVARMLSGRVADRKGRAFVMVPGVLLAASAIAILPLAHSLPVFLVSAAVFGLGFGAAQPATMALLVDQVSSDQRGLALSTYFLGYDLGISLGSIGLGAASQYLGLDAVWIIIACCMPLGLLGIVGARRQAKAAARIA